MTVADKPVRLLDRTQIDAAAELVSSALVDDPLVAWVAPGQNRRRKMTRLYAKNIYYGVRYGQVYTTEALEGVAVWLSPGNTAMTLGRIIRSGLGTTPFDLGWSGFWRIQRYTWHKAKMHKRLAPSLHWYLLVMAVSPSLQGRGLGKALVEPVLQRADRMGMPCYLETTNNHNLRFFEKMGFQIIAQDQVPAGGPAIWAMLRPSA